MLFLRPCSSLGTFKRTLSSVIWQAHLEASLLMSLLVITLNLAVAKEGYVKMIQNDTCSQCIKHIWLDKMRYFKQKCRFVALNTCIIQLSMPISLCNHHDWMPLHSKTHRNQWLITLDACIRSMLLECVMWISPVTFFSAVWLHMLNCTAQKNFIPFLNILKPASLPSLPPQP